MTTTEPTPTLDGRIIGQTERATRAVLDRFLADHDLPFETSVVLNLLDAAGGEDDADDLIARMLTGLRIPEIEVWAAVDDTRRRGLVDGTDHLALTADGRATFTAVQAGIGTITAALYGDLPEEDLQTAARVLLTITARAHRHLDTP